MADRNGVIYGTKSGLCRIANIEPDDNETAWENLLSPDEESADLLRNPENEGRRVEEIEGGFRLINFRYYQQLMAADNRSEQNRLAQQTHRQRIAESADSKKNVSSRKQASAKVSGSKPSDADADADAEYRVQKQNVLSLEKKEPKKAKPSREEVISYVRELGLPESDGHYCFDKWEGTGFKNGGQPIKDWRAVIRSHQRAGYLPSQKKGIQTSLFQKPKIADPNQQRIDEEWEQWKQGKAERQRSKNSATNTDAPKN